MAFFQDNLYPVRATQTSGGRDHPLLRVISGPESLPVDWSVIIGEIAHDLRSALDGLVCAVARQQNPSLLGVCDSTSFPIFLRGPRTNKMRRREAGRRAAFSYGTEDIRPLNAVTKAKIEGFQPYKSGRGHRRNALWRLHELNNTDKHRIITVLSPIAATVQFHGMAGHVQFHRNVRLRPGANIGWVTRPPANESSPGRGAVFTLDPVTWELVEPRLLVNVSVAPVIRFGTGCRAVERLPVVRTLLEMADEVSHVVESFTTDF